MTTPLGFTRQHIGQHVTSPGGLGGQCVDWANLWLMECGGAEQFANAVSWVTLRIPGWVWVPNGPSNAPPAGALVVWGPYPPLGIGQYGHIALALAADSMELVTSDQNWPPGAAVALVLHTYGGVLGWQQRAA